MSFPEGILDLAKPSRHAEGPEFRKQVEWLMLLRLVVTSLLLGVTIFLQLRHSPELAADTTLPLYILIATTFLLSIIYSLYLVLIPDLWVLSLIQVMVDLVYATILIHFTGGASSVFTLLYIFPIITSGILHFRRGALLSASAASILFGVLINLEFYRFIPATEWPWVMPWVMQASFYVLWVLVVNITSFFLVAVVSSSFAEQLYSTRTSLSIKERDFEQLSDLHTSIVRSIPSGLITADNKDLITFMNHSGAALLKVSPDLIVGSPLATVFPLIYDGILHSSVGRESFLTVKEIDGGKVHLELLITDLEGSDGLRMGRLVIFQDVTEIRKMEERVKSSERQAAFVRIAAGMAHEIRNPLASLRGAAELLSQSNAAPDMEKRLHGIVIRESDRLNSLLSDFLATVGPGKQHKVRVMLGDLVEETADLFSRDERVRGNITLETMINKGIEVEGEPARLKQAVWNLFANALEAMPDGGVIRVVLEIDAPARVAVLKVQDSGIGIPPEIKDRIFEPFTTTKDKGTGLGLSLVLSVAQEHGGTVQADSMPGQGSMFTLRLPLAPADKARA